MVRIFYLASIFFIICSLPVKAFPKADVNKSKFAKRAAQKAPQISLKSAAAYLANFGYLSKSQTRSVTNGGLLDAKTFAESIRFYK